MGVGGFKHSHPGVRRQTHGPHSLAGSKGLGFNTTTKAPPGEGDTHPRSRSLASRTRSCCPVGRDRPPESQGIPLVCPSFFLSKLLMYLGVSVLSRGPRGLPCIGQDLSPQSTDPQSWRGSAVARGVFLVSGRIFRCRARTPNRGGAQPWPSGSSLYQAGSAQHRPPVVAGLSAGPQAPQCLQHMGSPLDPRAAQLLHSMWDSHPPAQDRACIPCIARQVLTRWTTREGDLL